MITRSKLKCYVHIACNMPNPYNHCDSKAYPSAIQLATLGTAATTVARLLASLSSRQIGFDT